MFGAPASIQAAAAVIWSGVKPNICWPHDVPSSRAIMVLVLELPAVIRGVGVHVPVVEATPTMFAKALACVLIVNGAPPASGVWWHAVQFVPTAPGRMKV